MDADIYSYDLPQLEELLTGLGLPRFRAKQLHEWLHAHHATSYDQMTNLPKALREQLAEAFPLSKTAVAERAVSVDGTKKYLLRLADGALVETVGIPSDQDEDAALGNDGEDDGTRFDAGTQGRLTVCFSTQVGCGMGCIFCATGKEGFTRNLSTQEMVDQAIVVQKDSDRRISNIVAMGQGEPFLNYENVMAALRRFNADDGFRVGARHITISTCGIIDGIRKLADEPEQFTLAISLHSAIQAKRDSIMPALANQPLDELKQALLSYVEKKNRRVTLEYLMISGVNDSDEDLAALKRFCEGLLCHVNLIPLNETGSGLTGSSKATMDRWTSELEKAHVSTTIRRSKGADIAGACGQLKNASLISRTP